MAQQNQGDKQQQPPPPPTIQELTGQKRQFGTRITTFANAGLQPNSTRPPSAAFGESRNIFDRVTDASDRTRRAFRTMRAVFGAVQNQIKTPGAPITSNFLQLY